MVNLKRKLISCKVRLHWEITNDEFDMNEKGTETRLQKQH